MPKQLSVTLAKKNVLLLYKIRLKLENLSNTSNELLLPFDLLVLSWVPKTQIIFYFK